MKAYFFLAIGVLWLAAAITLRRTIVSVFWPRQSRIDPAVASKVFDFMFLLISYGWIIPFVFAFWLMGRRS